MHPQLMGTPGFWRELKEAVGIIVGQNLVMGDGFLPIRVPDHPPGPLVFVLLSQGNVNDALGFGGCAVHDGDIGFLGLVGHKQMTQALDSFGVASHDKAPAGLFVQAVGQGRFGGQTKSQVIEILVQGIAFARTRMHSDTCWFV